MSIWDKIYQWIWGHPERDQAPPSYLSPLKASAHFTYDHDRHPLGPETDTKPLAPVYSLFKKACSWNSGITPSHAKREIDYCGESNICIVFTQHADPQLKGWQAVVQMKANDVPKVMREGLYWTEVNLDKEAGYIAKFSDSQRAACQPSTTPHLPSCMSCQRVYFFQDLGEEPHWAAKMIVFCHDLDELSQFRFRDLRVDQTIFCAARDADGKVVYMFSRGPEPHSVSCVNTLYDDMPLDGWWPWPRRSEANGDSDSLLI